MDTKKVWFHLPLNVQYENSSTSFIRWLTLLHVFPLCFGLWYACIISCFDKKHFPVDDIAPKTWCAIEDHKSILNTCVLATLFPSLSSWNPPLECIIRLMNNI